MKPKPLVALNHFTVPVGILTVSLALVRATTRKAVRSLHRPRQLSEFGEHGQGRERPSSQVVGPHPAKTPGAARGCSRGSNYIVAPIFHGSNSSSPMPSASDLVFWPEAVFTINSKILRPLSWIVSSPSTI